jgi:hypothetical protein
MLPGHPAPQAHIEGVSRQPLRSGSHPIGNASEACPGAGLIPLASRRAADTDGGNDLITPPDRHPAGQRQDVLDSEISAGPAGLRVAKAAKRVRPNVSVKRSMVRVIASKLQAKTSRPLRRRSHRASWRQERFGEATE